LSKDQSAPRP